MTETLIFLAGAGSFAAIVLAHHLIDELRLTLEELIARRR